MTPRTRSKVKVPQASRRGVAIAAGCEPGGQIAAACASCGAPGRVTWFRRLDGRPSGWVHFEDLELDHIVAEAKGGPSDASNLQLLCQHCNRTKGCK